ncbi:MAG TPA: 4Fe-4S binding protein, partial [Chloroflexota bacterium]|nr:4Fe-4S binding protein [Chloroflexota bacterium]
MTITAPERPQPGEETAPLVAAEQIEGRLRVDAPAPGELHRRLLGRLDGLFGRAEGLLDRLGGTGAVGVRGETQRAALRPLNPLYHLGGLSFFLLVVVVVTGVYLVLFYKPAAEHAYASVEAISANPIGSAIRGVHRYASQGLVVTLLLHAIKALIGNRFTGARALSWISGWVMLGIFWLVGVMGYWLVWDDRAQWLTQYVAGMNGGTALAFASPEEAARNSSLFVIVLFLHVFVPALALLGVWFHVMRLARIRLWAPRWLAAQTALALAALAVWRPVQSGAPADVTRLVDRVALDAWFLGFLPLVERYGGWAVWGGGAVVGVALLATPRLLRGSTVGPAVVTDADCTGCRLCAQQCPYGAIEMRRRSDGLPFETVAVVDPGLCTACGLCVGVCSTDAIDLAGLSARRLKDGVVERVKRAAAAGQAPLAVFGCARHFQLGTVPDTHNGAPVIGVGVPCAGMVHGEWVRQALVGGARAALIVSGPHDDCAFREGPRWTHERLYRREKLQRQGVAWLEVAPGDDGAVRAALERLTVRGGPVEGHSVHPARTLLRFAVSLVPLALGAILVAALASVPAAPTSVPADHGQLRVVVQHKGAVKAASGAGLSHGEQSRLPEGVSAAQILGGERHPVRLRITAGGAAPLEREYRP